MVGNNERGSIINPLQLTDYPEELDDLTPEEIRKLMENSKDFKGSVSSKISWLKCKHVGKRRGYSEK